MSPLPEHNTTTITQGQTSIHTKRPPPPNNDTNENEKSATTTTTNKSVGVLYNPEKTLKEMDENYRTEFLSLVRNEENAKWVGKGLAHVLKDTQLVSAVWGIRWVTSRWHIHNIATLLKHATEEWTVHERAQITNLVSNDWPLSPHTSRLAYHMVERFEPTELVNFIVRMTNSWTIDAALHLISEIANWEKWSNEQLVEIANYFGGVLSRNRKMGMDDWAAISEFCAKAAEGLIKADWLDPNFATQGGCDDEEENGQDKNSPV